MPALIVAYPRVEGPAGHADCYARAMRNFMQESWSKQGVKAADVFLPVGADQPYASLLMLRFASMDLRDAVLSEPDPRVLRQFGDPLCANALSQTLQRRQPPGLGKIRA